MSEKRETELRRLQDQLLARIATAEDQAEQAVAGCERLRAERDEAYRTVREAHEAGTRVVAQRDALLEALKLARSIIGHPDDAHTQMIDAAIKAAEEGK